MARRIKIAFIFWYDTHWIAGPYYILNIIQSLNTLPDTEKPEITIISEKKDFFVVEETQYPYLLHFNKSEDHALSLYNRILKNSLKYFCDVKRFDKVINVDVVFPVIYAKNDYLVDVTRNIPFVYWIPDFQELYMPELFNSVDLQFRIDCCRKISSQKNKVVFSSVSVLNDYLKQYPEYNTINHVFHFSVFHPNIKTIEIEGLCVNKNIPSKYFFCANQFWQHKNHLTLFKALLQVKAVRNDIVVAFSGNENDERNKDYITILKTFISEHDLYTNVRFLGFIERTEQIALLSNAVAVIQPSLFEGWSTVVEDCKAQNQFVILSDIPVHREQMKNNVCFFNPIDSCALAENMIQIWDKRPQIEKGNYSFDQKKSGERFISIIKNLC